LVKHLKSHIAAGMKVKCPAQGCGRIFSKKSSFSAHLSVKHGILNKNTIDGELLVDCTSGAGANSDDDVLFPQETIVGCDTHDGDNNDDSDMGSADTVDKDAFLRNFSLFFLKLQCRFNVPASTVELIANEIFNLHQQNMDMCLQVVQSQLSSQNVDHVVIHEIVNACKQVDFFNAALNSDVGVLRSQHIRKRFYKENFRYVEPLEMKLGVNKYGRPSICHYISVQETLQCLLQDSSVAEYLNSPELSDCNIFRDLHDGYVYKHVKQTVKQMPFIQLILYQDAFEVVNPIGAARKKHKIMAVYMALANLPPHLRTSIDNLQLVLLCRDSDVNVFGQDKIFQCLLDDLMYLECNGTRVNGRLYEVRLICVLGDNLGSHWVGGFSTSFSINQYVCRYCVIQRTCDNSALCKTTNIRTPDMYNNAVNCLSDTVSSVHGVVRASVFNNLKHYHVCLPGLPPCLGHDLFEGVVQFDLSLILKHLDKNVLGSRGMLFKHLNLCIQHFKFVGGDANDKPGVVSDGKAVGGNAAQVWCLLRLIPFFLYDAVDVQNDAWKMLMLLSDIVELICAPQISMAQILFLNRLILQYVEDRAKLFPSVSMRPKHHYLLHYPWLIQMFGPLMRVWTMRMESKHSFFKRCACACQNFINITKTLSDTHQLSQAFLYSGSLVCENVELGCDACEFDVQLFSHCMVSAVKHCVRLHAPLRCSSNVTVKGTTYSKGAFVVLSCVDSAPSFGKVLLCLLDNTSKAGVVVELCESAKNQDLGLFVVQNHNTQMLQAVMIDELFDYYPLSSYSICGLPHIALKHAVYVSV